MKDQAETGRGGTTAWLQFLVCFIATAGLHNLQSPPSEGHWQMSLPREAISFPFLVNVASLNAGNALKPKHVMIGFRYCIESMQYLCRHVLCHAFMHGVMVLGHLVRLVCLSVCGWVCMRARHCFCCRKWIQLANASIGIQPNPILPVAFFHTFAINLGWNGFHFENMQVIVKEVTTTWLLMFYCFKKKNQKLYSWCGTNSLA